MKVFNKILISIFTGFSYFLKEILMNLTIRVLLKNHLNCYNLFENLLF